MKRLWIIVVVAMIAGSCNNEKMTDKSFDIGATVESYVSLTRSNEAMLGDVISASVADGGLDLGLSLFGSLDCSVVNVYNNDSYALRYRQLQSKYGDKNPVNSTFRYYKNSTIDDGWRVESGECRYTCFSDKIEKITITSSHAWDASHPAGIELNDIFTVEFTTLYDYIKRGFIGTPTQKYKQVLSDIDAEYYSLIVLGSSDKPLNVENMLLRTTTLPSDYKNHTIKVSMTLDSGETIEYTHKLDK